MAAENGRLEFARMLHEHGATIDFPNNTGQTALHIASYHGHVAVVLLLLEYGADPNVRDKYGRTPSDFASEMGRGKIVELLSKNSTKSIASFL
jgi:ankyrin repeat protein